MKIYVECDASYSNAVRNKNKYYILAGEVHYKKNPIYFEKDHKVPNDSERGFLIHNGTEWDYILPQTYKMIKLVKHKSLKRLALILESPHKDEYDKVGNIYVPIAPALGETGVKLRGGITKRKFMDLLDPNYDYIVGLFNAVQYQCSCFNYIDELKGIDTVLRDEVFRLLFPKVQQYLILELQHFAPDIIVNCCTGDLNKKRVPIKSRDKSKMRLNWLVDKKIRDDISMILPLSISKCRINDIYCCDTHPSTWK